MFRFVLLLATLACAPRAQGVIRVTCGLGSCTRICIVRLDSRPERSVAAGSTASFSVREGLHTIAGAVVWACPGAGGSVPIADSIRVAPGAVESATY